MGSTSYIEKKKFIERITIEYCGILSPRHIVRKII